MILYPFKTPPLNKRHGYQEVVEKDDEEDYPASIF